MIQSNPGLSISRQIVKRALILRSYGKGRWESKGYLRAALRATREAGLSRSGRKALVIANGHSASLLNISGVIEARSKGLDVYAMNSFLLSDLSKLLTPTHYVLSDPQHHPSHSGALSQNLWAALDAHPEIQLVAPHDWYPTLKERRPSSMYFNNCGLQGWTTSTSPLKAMGYIYLTAYKALAFALHLGYMRVSIIGFDNSGYLNFSVDERNEIYYGGDTHFYSRDSPAQNFTGMYPQGMADCLFDYALCLLDLERCFKLAPIVNLDLSSRTSAFPKEADAHLIQPSE